MLEKRMPFYSTDNCCTVNDISSTTRMYFSELWYSQCSIHSILKTLFLFATKSNRKCSLINKTVLSISMHLPVSVHPPLHILLSFTTLFSAMNTLASFCRDSRDSNLPARLAWTDSYFPSLLFNAGLLMKRVTVQRIGDITATGNTGD